MANKSLRFLLLICMLISSFVFTPVTVVHAISLPAQMNKKFAPIVIKAGDISRLSITIFNPNSFQLTAAHWDDVLNSVQPGIFLANPINLVNGCGGSVVGNPGDTTLTLNGGTVPAQVGNTPGECTVSVNVSSITTGNLINTIPIGELESTGNDNGNSVQISNTTPASATLEVNAVQPPSLSKSFTPNTMWVGQTSQLAIVIRNNDLTTALTQTSLTDNLPAGVTLVNPVSPTFTNCGVPPGSLTADLVTNSIALNNSTIAPNSTCTVRVNVTSSIAGTYTNTIPINSLHTQQGGTNTSPATAPLNVQSVAITKAFSPANFQAGGTSTLTITLQNPTGSPITGVNLSDTLPGTVLTFPPPFSAATTCGGSVVATLPRTVSLTGGTIPAGNTTTPGTCTITVQVTTLAGAAAATFTNTIPAGALTIPSQPGITNVLPASAQVRVYTTGTGVTANKSFNPTTIAPNGNSRLRINITAPADTDLTNFHIDDPLPTNVTVSNSTPASTNGCGAGALTTATGATSISLNNGTILAGTTCQINVFVTSSIAGVYTNTVTPANISNTQNRKIANNITANLTVQTTSPLSISKAFSPTTVIPGGISTLTITLQNSNASPLVNVTLTDTLPGNTTNGVVIAASPNVSSTCTTPANITAVTGTQSISMVNGTIPSQVAGVPGICTINVNVQGRGNAATRNNTIPIQNVSGTIQGTTTTVNPATAASASLTIANLSINVVKGFDPLTVFGGSASTLSVQLVNPNNVAQTGIGLSDNMPIGMIIATPANSSPPGTCGGTLTAVSGAGSFSFIGGSLPASGTCTLTMSVTMTVNGNLTNTIPANSVTTSSGATNPQPAAASLTNLPGASISKFFAPSVINSGGVSVLTITIQNTSTIPLDGMSLTDTLPGALPGGVVIANPPNASTTCSDPAHVPPVTAGLTTTAGTQTIQLTNGSLAANASCTIVVSVTGTTPGSYDNTIPTGALLTTQGASNNLPATANLVINATALANIGDFVWNDLNADGIQDAGEAGIPNVTVNLLNSGGTVIGTTTTDANGFYHFTNLTPGTYGIEFVPPAGYTVSPANQGANDAVDSDANTVTGRTGNYTLVAGQTDNTVDAGMHLTALANIGDFVWNDLNADGIQDAGEAGIPNVTVHLLNSVGTVIGTTTTNANGLYSFTNLTPGTYGIEFVPPAGYTISPANQGANDAVDSDANTATGRTGNYSLIAGQTDNTVDAGMHQAVAQNGLTKAITATNQASTSGTQVTIGEIVTYQTSMDIAPGTYNNAQLIDTLDKGLAFVNCVSISGPGLSTSNPNGFSNVCSTPTVETFPNGSGDPADVDRRATFNFGTLTNNGASNATLTVTYRAVVLDSAGNLDGVSLNNSASFAWTGGSLGPASAAVQVIEPKLSIDKTANNPFVAVGSDLTYTLTIQHTAASHTDAFDVSIVDPLPVELDFVTGSLDCTTGAQPPTTCVYDNGTRTVTATWTTFSLNGGNGVILFHVVPNAIPGGNGPITNVGTVDWSSLPGNFSQPQSFTPNAQSTERFYDPNSPINVYGTSAQLSLTPLGGASGGGGGGGTNRGRAETSRGLGFLIPITGFAPGKVTDMSGMPVTTYDSSNDLTLDVPKLKLKMPIVGVALNNGSWDVNWLLDRAGWLEKTAFPTFTGNSVLTGHVTLSNGDPGPFARLSTLAPGDKVFVHAFGQLYIYQVRTLKTVIPSDISIFQHEDKAWLTLVTCGNYDDSLGVYLNRTVVRAELIQTIADPTPTP